VELGVPEERTERMGQKTGGEHFLQTGEGQGTSGRLTVGKSCVDSLLANC
jgi:hypothetical protein